MQVGATNRPQELDEAARRRLQKKLYIPLPDSLARRDLITHLLANENHDLAPQQIAEVVQKTQVPSHRRNSYWFVEAVMPPCDRRRASLAQTCALCALRLRTNLCGI